MKGVFPNTDTNDCKTYIICDSNLEPSVYNCDENTYFWPLHNGCFSHYDCATDSMPDVYNNENPCDGFPSYETIQDKYSTDCSSYLLCYWTERSYDNEWIRIPLVESKSCNSGTYFKPGIGNGCMSGYKCADYECTTEGLFVNPNVNDCSSYVKCKKYTSSQYTGTGSLFYNVLKICPPGTKYSPFLRKCDSFYNCNGMDPHNGIDPCLQYNPANPFVVNPYENDCKTYIECMQWQTDPFSYTAINVVVKKTCPTKTYFSPNMGNCYYNHKCNQPDCTKDPCNNGPGKFVDYKSVDCERFIECRDDSDTQGVYRPTYEKRYCPPGSLFSPDTTDCDPEYICPGFPNNYCYDVIPTTTTTSTSTVDPD